MKITMEYLVASRGENLSSLEERLGYRFVDRTLLQRALVHSSFAYEQAVSPEEINNERLEFLGDAVIDLVVGHALFRLYPEMKEGDLTKVRAALVNENHLTLMAQEIGIGSHLLLGRGEDGSKGREKPSILSSAYEAIAGAIFLDGGYESVRAFVELQFTSWLERGLEMMREVDAKSRLQEILQERFGATPTYALEKSEGPDHRKIFTVSVRFEGDILATGQAGNKKDAEQKAAASAIEAIMDKQWHAGEA